MSENAMTTTDMQAELQRIASELRAYNPAGDEYKGEHIHKIWARAIEAALASRPDAQADERGAFQSRVHPWMLACFGSAVAADTVERNHRFFEEAAELVQACGMTASEAHQLVDYTWSRPIGEKTQEVGGVMVTLAALCLANGLDMHAAGETELARISAPEIMAKIRAKQAAKPKHSPLPEARAAAPQAEAAQGVADEWKLVPVKPTAEMLDAGLRHIPALHVWNAMLAAAPSPDRERVGEGSHELGYAQRLVTSVWEKHYMDDAPDWKPLPDLMGVLTQIDNMLAGMVPQKDASPSRECGKRQGAAMVDRERWEKVLSFAKGIISRLDTTEVMRSSVNGIAYDAAERAMFIRNLATEALAAPAVAPTLGEQFEQLDIQNHTYRRVMQKIMKRLTELLDEDRFAEIEGLVKSAGVEPPTAAQPGLTDEQRIIDLQAEIDRLNAIIDTPQSGDFLRAVSIEAEHQRQRWCSSHDAGKTPADWFWLVGYLGGKALHAHAAGNVEKAEHHVITTAAACENWHRNMFGKTDMRPGIDGEAALGAKGD